MISKRTVLVTHENDALRWNLASPTNGRLVLLAWRVLAEADRDGAVPDEIAELLARAICTTNAVTFPDSASSSLSVNETTRALGPIGLREQIRTWRHGVPSNLRLVTTRSPETVRRVFDSAEFPWTMQGAIAFLSAPAQPAPKLSLELVLSMSEPIAVLDGRSMAAMGVRALLRPGVDGAVAGLFTTDLEVEAESLAAIFHEAIERGFDWHLVTESDFVDLIAEPWLTAARAD
jgi:hypothetical protein